MPEIGVGREYPLCPEGADIFRLKEVEKKDMPVYGGTGTNERLIWKFVSRGRDPETGEFYEVAIFTPPYYTGHSKSKLTWLMRLIDKRVNKDWVKANGLNTDQYVGRDYEAMIQHQLSEDGSKTYATFAYLKPLVDKASADAVATGADVFAAESPGDAERCGACGKALSDGESAACIQRWKGARYLCLDHAKAQIQAERAAEEDLFAAV